MSLLTGGQPSAPTQTGDPWDDAYNQQQYQQQMAEWQARMNQSRQLMAANEAQRTQGARSLSDYLGSDEAKAGQRTAFGQPGDPLAVQGLSEQDFIDLIARMKGAAT